MAVFPITKLPISIPGCVLWLDAVQTATGAISSWTDMSGRGNHCTQVTGSKQPVCTANQLNGKNTLLFDISAHQTLQVPSALNTISAGNNTVFVVGKRNSETGLQCNFITSDDSGVGRFSLALSPTAGTVVFISDSTGAIVSISGNTNTVYNVITAGRVGTTQLLAINDGATATNNSASDALTISSFYIGSRGDSANYLNGGIGEIILYNQALSDSDILKVKRYLGNKWGIVSP